MTFKFKDQRLFTTTICWILLTWIFRFRDNLNVEICSLDIALFYEVLCMMFNGFSRTFIILKVTLVYENWACYEVLVLYHSFIMQNENVVQFDLSKRMV